jgi:hypothetical protein
MVERITSEADLRVFLQERELASRLRNAISFCKNSLEMQAVSDRNLKAEECLGLERCLTENYLVKEGLDYFGKRDLIYIDLYGSEDLQRMRETV